MLRRASETRRQFNGGGAFGNGLVSPPMPKVRECPNDSLIRIYYFPNFASANLTYPTTSVDRAWVAVVAAAVSEPSEPHVYQHQAASALLEPFRLFDPRIVFFLLP